MRVSGIALILVGACRFTADYQGTHYACDPHAPSCPAGQVCSRDGECRAPEGDQPDAGAAPDASSSTIPTPDAPPGEKVITFGERDGTDVRGVTHDTYVLVTQPTNNYGRNDDVSFDADPLQYAFLHFDLSSIPPGTQVDAVELDLYFNDPVEDGDAVLAPVTEAWSENDATYINRQSGVPWSVPGGTVGELVYVFTPRTIGMYQLVLPPALVQGWVDTPSTNHGVRFASTSTMGRGGVFDSSESSPQDQRPLLKVTVTSP